MAIPGFLVEGAPFFKLGVRGDEPPFDGHVRFLADTGAARTAILLRDARHLGLDRAFLSGTRTNVTGVGGSVEAVEIASVALALPQDGPPMEINMPVYVILYAGVGEEQRRRLLRLPSLLGRDLLGRFRFTFDPGRSLVRLEPR